jgi:hypothetical protein
MAINHLTAAKLCVEMKIEALLRRDDCTEVADYQHAKKIHRRAQRWPKNGSLPVQKRKDFGMLFGTCNCNPGASSISRRGLLCAGGAGFVSALIGTLVGASRTAHAQPLDSRVPEVDRLAVRMVTDNQVVQFVPSEKREDLAIERRTGSNTTPDAPCPSRESYPLVAMMQSGQDRCGDDVPCSLDGSS